MSVDGNDGRALEPMYLGGREADAAALRASRSIGELYALADRLLEGLEADRQIRKKSDNRLLRVAWLTLIANWGALIIALIALFLR